MSIEVDPSVLAKADDEDYASSGYDTSIASLTSSVNQYVFENGRRYHAYYGTDKYLMPTDETEQDRLDLHHELMRLVWDGSLHEAPLKEPHRILDIGTGTGIWAIDMAEKFPNAEVIGTDISPIQPGWVPANCRFEVDDAMLEWTFKENFFDHIHGRNISAGVTNWDHLMSEIMRCLAPGGYVEFCENSLTVFCDDGSMADDNPVKVFTDTLRKSLIKMGRSPPDMEFMKNLLVKGGFDDIQTITAKEPIGPWAKELRLKKVGVMVLLHTESLFESYGMAAFTRILDMDVDEARGICERAHQASRNKNYHMYGMYNRVYGRKPRN